MSKTVRTALAAPLLVFGLMAGAAQAATPRDALVMAWNLDALITFDPAQIAEVNGNDIIRNVCEPLVDYDLMELLVELSQASGTADGPPSLWLLVAQPGDGMPTIDGTVLPVIAASNWARLTDSWLDNMHRAGGRSAA